MRGPPGGRSGEWTGRGLKVDHHGFVVGKLEVGVAQDGAGVDEVEITDREGGVVAVPFNFKHHNNNLALRQIVFSKK